nr:ubinuclein-1-like [Leptinotarsa decemlineata]
MSEIKRVALTTFQTQKVSDKSTKNQCKTLRISVILPESNEDNCPEYNYKDQVEAIEKKSRQGKDSNNVENVENGLDPFGETDDDVRRIALEMEAKYGTGMTDGKKKRKGRKDDYADIGMGYDESDSFIDNTDGYDEIIPQNVTTLHGGFYINCGALEFKTDDEASSQISSSSSSSEDEEGNQPKTNRKRILETSGESDSETGTTTHTEKKVKLQAPKNTMQQAIKKKLFSANKIQVKKRRPIDPLKKTVKDLLREKREDLNMTVPEELKEIEENMEKDSLKENKVPMSISSVTDAIESVLKQVVQEENCAENQDKQIVAVETKSSPNISKNVLEISQPQPMETESSQELNKIEKREAAKLPENLPADIMEIVEKIRNAAINYKGEGKKAFYTDEVNLLLLSLERKCKVLGKSSRLRVYEHLSSYVVCRKETLIKRAKNLVLEDEEKRLKILTVKLKDTIDRMMPSLLTNYEHESQKVLQKKFSKESGNNEDNKALKMPRRKFQWTDEAKRLIKDILSIKKRCLILEGKQKDKLEEQAVEYLRAVILPLWPEGWMYLNNLKKVYNSMSESSKLIDSKSASSNSNPNKSKHSISNSSSTTSTKVLNSSVSKLGSDVQLYPLTNIQNVSSSGSGVFKESDKPVGDQGTNVSFSTKTEPLKRLNEIEVFKPYAEKYPKSSPQNLKSISPEIDKPSDLSKSSKYNDMFKPYVSEGDLSKKSGQGEVFKPYTEKNVLAQEHSSFPFADRTPGKAVESEPQTNKYMGFTKKYIPHSDTVSSNVDKVTAYPENMSSYVENYVSQTKKHASEKIPEAHVQKPVVHPENPSLYSDSHGSHKDNSVFYPEKSVLSPSHCRTQDEKYSEQERTLAQAEKPNVIEKHRYTEKPQNVEKASYEKLQYSKNLRQSFEETRHLEKASLETARTGDKSCVDKPKPLNDHYEDKSRRGEKSDVEKPRHVEKSHHPEKHRHMEKSMHSEKPRHMEKSHHSEKHRHLEKSQHVEKSRQADHHQTVENFLASIGRLPPKPESLTSHGEASSLSGKVPYDEMPSDLSKHFRQGDLFKPIDKPKDFSSYEMFKPYAETSKTHAGDFSKHHRSKEHYRQTDILKTQSERQIIESPPSRHDTPSSSKHSRSNDVRSDNLSTPKHRLMDLPKMLDDSGVIVKNTYQSIEDIRKLPREDHNAVISKVSHCPGIVSDKRKILSDPRTPDLFTEMRSSDYFSKAANNVMDYHSTPVKTEGDDIQMVMENLKALQKLSCSPVKNDNSSSSPVSVIAYNKNFSSSKSNSVQKSDSNNKGDLTGGFQDEFQKQFINSLQQMAANPSTSKSSYNRCS